MKITHVLRGEDLLPSTPRQIALYRALIDIGVTDFIPEFGHLPYVMGEGNKKLSKRDPTSSLNLYRDEGYVPEGLLNYLALLGWSIADDHDIFSLAEMVEAFDVSQVNANPARFDPKKCESINATHIRMLEPADFAARLVVQAGGHAEVITAAAPLVQERIQTLSEGVAMLNFLLVDDASFAIEPAAAAKQLNADGLAVIAATVAALEPVDWTTSSIETALHSTLVDGLGLKPRNAYSPIRVAVTGRTVSPPLFESLELLGRERSLARLRAVLDSGLRRPVEFAGGSPASHWWGMG